MEQNITYSRKQRSFAALLCAALIFVTLASSLFLIGSADHDCTGAACAVCANLKEAEDNLKNLGTGTGDAEITAFLAGAVFALIAVLGMERDSVPVSTPVEQRVRLNN